MIHDSLWCNTTRYDLIPLVMTQYGSMSLYDLICLVMTHYDLLWLDMIQYGFITCYDWLWLVMTRYALLITWFCVLDLFYFNFYFISVLSFCCFSTSLNSSSCFYRCLDFTMFSDLSNWELRIKSCNVRKSNQSSSVKRSGFMVVIPAQSSAPRLLLIKQALNEGMKTRTCYVSCRKLEKSPGWWVKRRINKTSVKKKSDVVWKET